MVQIENKQQDERFIPNNINNHIKCELSLYDFYVITQRQENYMIDTRRFIFVTLYYGGRGLSFLYIFVLFDLLHHTCIIFLK